MQIAGVEGGRMSDYIEREAALQTCGARMDKEDERETD